MELKTKILIIRAILESHNISDNMIMQYYTKTYDASKTGIPEDYFYLLVKSKINNAVEIVLRLTDKNNTDKNSIVSAIKTEFLES